MWTREGFCHSQESEALGSLTWPCSSIHSGFYQPPEAQSEHEQVSPVRGTVLKSSRLHSALQADLSPVQTTSQACLEGRDTVGLESPPGAWPSALQMIRIFPQSLPTPSIIISHCADCKRPRENKVTLHKVTRGKQDLGGRTRCLPTSTVSGGHQRSWVGKKGNRETHSLPQVSSAISKRFP